MTRSCSSVAATAKGGPGDNVSDETNWTDLNDPDTSAYTKSKTIAERTAWECPACGRVASEGGACPLDGTQMEERKEGLDLAVHQTLAHGGTVLALLERQDLEPVEGIGALLRF